MKSSYTDSENKAAYLIAFNPDKLIHYGSASKKAMCLSGGDAFSQFRHHTVDKYFPARMWSPVSQSARTSGDLLILYVIVGKRWSPVSQSASYLVSFF